MRSAKDPAEILGAIEPDGFNLLPITGEHAARTIELPPYHGLSSPELRIQRVRERVRSGGHDIPEERIRSRYASSRANLIKLMPHLASLRVYDNSIDADPKAGHSPQPILLLHREEGQMVFHIPLENVPQWAKPILAVAFAA
jgi:predicted ABC-type ATPase